MCRIIVRNRPEVERGGVERAPPHKRASVVKRPVSNFTSGVTVVPVEMVNAWSVLRGFPRRGINLFATAMPSSRVYCEHEQLQRC